MGQKVRNLRGDRKGNRSLFRSASECKNPSACLGKCINARINCWVRRKGRIAHIFGQLPSVKHCNLFRLKYETLGGGGVKRVHLLTCLPPLPVSSRVSKHRPLFRLLLLTQVHLLPYSLPFSVYQTPAFAGLYRKCSAEYFGFSYTAIERQCQAQHELWEL